MALAASVAKKDDKEAKTEAAMLRMQHVQKALEQHDVGPCLTWLSSMRAELSTTDFDILSFLSHRLEFLQIALQKEALEALAYARKHLNPMMATRAAGTCRLNM